VHIQQVVYQQLMHGCCRGRRIAQTQVVSGWSLGTRYAHSVTTAGSAHLAMLQLQLQWRILTPSCRAVPFVSCEVSPAGKTI